MTRIVYSAVCILALAGCKHTLEIVGAGDIVELNRGERGCTLEQFQRRDPACMDNAVTEAYDVVYQARPRAGWRFVRWEGGCREPQDPSACSFRVSRGLLDWWEENHGDKTVPPLVAVFEPSDAGRIDLGNLPDYAGQTVPYYITRDNTADNPVTDEGASLGRVLFYDRRLSTNRRIACASCHLQASAFSDPRVVSEGVNGVTERHSPRLINTRFSLEGRFFWDERAASLELQTTQPIRDHAEMGFSGRDGNPSIDDLIARLEGLSYYPPLFAAAFGDNSISEERIQNALAQFVRSIQSFDSRFDEGMDRVGGDFRATFPNYTDLESRGKELFLRPPVLSTGENLNANGSDRGIVGVRRGGGLGCSVCHNPPEFSISPSSGNNGVITANSGTGTDTSVTRSPTLRDIFSPAGVIHGPLMHDGSMRDFHTVLDHYNHINADPATNPGLDPRLTARNSDSRSGTFDPGQQLMIRSEEREAIIAFMKTLTGRAVYGDARWASPFDQEGRLVVVD